MPDRVLISQRAGKSAHPPLLGFRSNVSEQPPLPFVPLGRSTIAQRFIAGLMSGENSRKSRKDDRPDPIVSTLSSLRDSTAWQPIFTQR